MKMFNSNEFESQLFDKFGFLGTSLRASELVKAIEKILAIGKVLFKCFEPKWNEVFGLRKKCAKEFFPTHSASSFFAKGGPETNSTVNELRTSQIKGVLSKLGSENFWNRCDTSKLRKDVFLDICCVDVDSWQIKSIAKETDNLFKNVAVNKSLRNVLMFGAIAPTRKSLSVLIRIGTMITDAVDSIEAILVKPQN